MTVHRLGLFVCMQCCERGVTTMRPPFSFRRGTVNSGSGGAQRVVGRHVSSGRASRGERFLRRLALCAPVVEENRSSRHGRTAQSSEEEGSVAHERSHSRFCGASLSYFKTYLIRKRRKDSWQEGNVVAGRAA